MRIGGLERGVDPDCAVGAQFQTGLFGQTGLGGRAHRDDRQVVGDSFTITEERPVAAVLLFHGGQGGL